MTHRDIRTEADGTRVYSNRTRYKPKPASERKYAVRKPDDPTAVRWKGDWWVDPGYPAEDARVMPTTRPDTVAFDHWFINKRCKCDVCRRPEADEWKRMAYNRWLIEQGY